VECEVDRFGKPIGTVYTIPTEPEAVTPTADEIVEWEEADEQED